jgi:hypothetical protein
VHRSPPSRLEKSGQTRCATGQHFAACGRARHLLLSDIVEIHTFIQPDDEIRPISLV